MVDNRGNVKNSNNKKILMSLISIWGDFKAHNPQKLSMSEKLLSLIDRADLNIVNFEAPIKSNGKPIKKSGPNICQDQDSPEWLELRGFNAISLANNHTMDFGDEGLSATISAFKKAKVMGAGSWNEAYQMNSFTTKDGLTIGVISCTHCEFGTLTDKQHAIEMNMGWGIEHAQTIAGGFRRKMGIYPES